MKIILSIVIPAYNCQETIKNLLLSINKSKFRRFKEIEAVLVDDGSKDKTIEEIKKITPKLKFSARLIILRKNQGPAVSRNLGVAKSHGRYVLFLDSDVELFPKTLGYAFKLAEENKIKAFTGIWHYRQKPKNFSPSLRPCATGDTGLLSVAAAGATIFSQPGLPALKKNFSKKSEVLPKAIKVRRLRISS